MLKVYNDDGYVDIASIAATGYPFIWIVGGRGTGKTYNGIGYITSPERQSQFFFLRRTLKEAELIDNALVSPFAKYGRDHNILFYHAKVVGDVGGIYNGEEIDGRIKPISDLLGYTGALSTLANVRGFDGDLVNTMFFDEFVKEPHIKPIKDEADAFLHVYETINRNRELEGRPPLQSIACSNSFEMANPYFVKFGFVDRAERMRETGKEVYFDTVRGHLLIVLSKSEISEKKAKTALYRATQGTNFADVALSNKFGDRGNYGKAKSKNLRGMMPICFVGELAIYVDRNTRRLYVSGHRTGNAPEYGNNTTDLQRFKQLHGAYVWRAYILSQIDFERLSLEIVLRNYLK